MSKANTNYIVTNSGEIRFNCPECGDENFHLYVNVSKGVFHCFRCNWAGTVNVLPRDIRAALDFPSPPYSPPSIKGISLPSEYYPLWMGALEEVLRYLSQRGMNLEDVERFKVGYCSTGKYKGRVIIPAFRDGILVGFEARVVSPGGFGARKKVLFEGKKDGFFNEDILKEGGSFVLVEGVFDVLAVGRDKGLGCWGHSLTRPQLDLLYKHRPSEVTVFFDADVKEQALNEADKLIGFVPNVKIAFLDEGDPADYENPLSVAKVERYSGGLDKIICRLRWQNVG